jgi:hypothetical protein
MKENWKYVLLEYDYKYDCQGTDEYGHAFALIHCPQDCSFNNIRSTLIQEKYEKFYHEIDVESVKDITIEW